MTEKTPERPRRQRREEAAMPSGVVGRAGRLAAASLRSSIRLAMLGPRTLLGRDSPKKLMEDLHAATAQEMLLTLGRLKGASMKVGQLASFIDAGVLPQDANDLYQQALASLRDAAPPMKPRLVREAFRREFDAAPSEMFASFQEVPIAAASLGQVHLATLEDGRQVAVKIQYPGIERAIRSDLAMTATVKPMIPLLAPGLDANDAVEEIRTRVLQECNYLREADNLEYLAERYDGHPFLWVPRPLRDLTTPRILTMQRAVGSSFESIKAMPQADRNRIGEILFRFYYGSLHRFGFTSADPHPGNYLLMKDGRMALFDFGLTFEVTEELRGHMHAGILALRDGDVDRFFEHGVAMRFVTKPQETNPKKFFDWVSFSLAPLIADENYTFTRDFIAERTEALMDPRNKWWSFIRHLNLPRWSILSYRLELGLFAVLAQLGATANWHRILLEFYEGDPSTDLGRAAARWQKNR